MIDECRFPFHHDKDYIDFHSIIIGPLHFSFTILWPPEITLKYPIIKTEGKIGKIFRNLTSLYSKLLHKML